MTVTNEPNATPTLDPSATEETAVTNVVQGAVTLLGLAGVSLPAAFQSLAFEQQLAGFIVAAFGAAWSLYSHLKTKQKLLTTQAQLVQARYRASRP